MWKNIVEPGRQQMTVWGKRIPCSIPKVKNTHSEYAIPIAFPLQQWLHERTSLLRYMHIACLVYNYISLFSPKSIFHYVQ